MTSRFSLCDEKQSVIWQSPPGITEVDIAFASEIDMFATYAEASQAAEKLLTGKSAKPTWADVRPLEECAR